MPRDRTSRLLDEFTAVTEAAPRPDTRRFQMRSRFPVATLSAASLVIVVVAVAAIVLGRPAVTPGVGASPTTTAPTPIGSAAAPPSGGPSAGACDLASRITSWEGAAGQRIATVEMTNRAATDCLVEVLDRPQFVDGAGHVLVEGSPPPQSQEVLQLTSGAHLTTLVAVGNWCKPTPQAPVSVAFVFADGQRLVADPFGPSDMTLPPCNGAGVPATITMHPWAA